MKLSTARLDVDRVRALLEERLASEGLAPIERGGSQWAHATALQTGARVGRVTPDATSARVLYLSWARGLLRERRYFPRQRIDAKVSRRDVWRLHADGRSNAEVALKLGTTRAVVEKALRLVVRRAPPPPVANPWRRSGRDSAWSAIEQRKGERMAKTTNETKQDGWQRYSLIRMRAGESVDVPGKGEKTWLADVDGIPHVGGIDVRFDGRGYDLLDKGGAVVMANRNNPDGGLDVVITVPWYKIKQSERVTEAA